MLTGLYVQDIITLYVIFSEFFNSECFQPTIGRPLGSVVKDMVIGTARFRFVSRVGQIGHKVNNCLPPLRRCFGVVLPKR